MIGCVVRYGSNLLFINKTPPLLIKFNNTKVSEYIYDIIDFYNEIHSFSDLLLYNYKLMNFEYVAHDQYPIGLLFPSCGYFLD